MVDRGLVEKRRYDADRRGACVAVTDEGRRRIAAAAPRHVATVRRLFVDLLSPEELDVVAAIAERVLNGIRGPGP
jgi:DNA-binding MarR family transcriptional regulator